jgi:signal transduction histidine kinase
VEGDGTSRDRLLLEVAHDLRGPIAVIAGLAQVLATTSDPAEVTEATAAIERSARKLELIADRLAASARGES